MKTGQWPKLDKKHPQRRKTDLLVECFCQFNIMNEFEFLLIEYITIQYITSFKQYIYRVHNIYIIEI